MAEPILRPSFVAGEVAPSFFGNVPNQHYGIGCSTMRNAFVSYRGGAYSRAGTAFVGFSKQTGRSYPPRLIRFQFNLKQGLTLEFGHQYMRVIQNGAFVTETSITITGISKAAQAVVTAANSYSNGDWVYITGVNGMTQVNGQTYVISNRAAGSFALNDVYGNPINSSAFGTYVSGGSAARIYTVATVYNEADLEFLKFTQSADVMSFTCWNQKTNTSYPTWDLTRIANNNFSFTQVTFAPTISAPNTINLSITHPAGQLGTSDTSAATYGYQVTAVNPVDLTESVASPAGATQCANIAVTSGSVIVTWGAVQGANQYNIYKTQPIAGTTTSLPPSVIPAGVLYGYAGSSYGTSFTDSNVVPDFAQTPPRHTNPFAVSPIVGVTILTGGTGGTGVPAVTITTSTGSGAVILPVFISQSSTVTACVVLDGGQGYAPGDTISFSGGGFSVEPTATLQLGPSSGTYPSVVTYFQERRVYAATPNQPDTYFMSQPGAFTNFDTRIPTIDSDAITGTPWSQRVDGIQFMVSMPGGLVVLTGQQAWQLTGVGGSSLNPQPITPADQQAQPQAYNGCHYNIPPFVLDYEVFYVQAKGSIVRVFSYNFFVNIYTGTDITYLSSHLFQPFGTMAADGILREWAWCEEPYKLLWATREDGTFLSLTYLKPQEVAGWARHDTQGQVWSVASVTELPVDALYMATQRDQATGHAQTFMIERMDNRLWSGIQNCWCVDAALSFTTTASTAVVSGLNHLIGATVTGLYGGIVLPPQVVSPTGTITLPATVPSGTFIVIGLAFTAQVQSLYLDAGQPTIQGRRKKVAAATARVEATAGQGGLSVGCNQPDASTQSPMVTSTTWTNMAAIPDKGAVATASWGATYNQLFTGDIRVPITGGYDVRGQVAIQQTNPLPLQVLAFVPEMLPGDIPETDAAPRGRRAAP